MSAPSYRFPQEKADEARKLRAEGLTYRAIAEQLGVSAKSTHRWCRHDRPRRSCEICGTNITHLEGKRKSCDACWPERENRRKRAHEDARRASCSECGATLGAGSGYPSHGRGRCDPCRRAFDARVVASRGNDIEAWWAEGQTAAEIAAHLGWSTSHLSREMHRLRGKGFDLPYRYAYTNPRFPAQVPT